MDQHTLTSKISRSIHLLSGFLVLLVIAVVGVAALLTSNRQRNQDTRSQASESDRPSLTLVPTTSSDTESVYELRFTPGKQDVSLTGLEATIEVESTSKVLGLIAQAPTTSIKSTPTRKEAPAPELPKIVTPTPTTVTIVIPCFSQVIDGTTPSWSNSCKGIPGQTNCQNGIIPLSSQDKTRYEIWKKYGRPQVPGCGLGATARPITTPTSTTQAVPTPSSVGTSIYKTTSLQIETTVGNLLTFESPQILANTDMKQSFTLKARVNSRNSDVQNQFKSSVTIAILRIPKSKPDQTHQVSLLSQNIQGASSLAPGVIMKLSSEEAKTEATSSSQTR